MDPLFTYNLAVGFTGICTAKTLYENVTTYPNYKQMVKKSIIPVALAALAINQAVESYNQLDNQHVNQFGHKVMPREIVDSKTVATILTPFIFVGTPAIVAGIEIIAKVCGLSIGFLIPIAPAGVFAPLGPTIARNAPLAG